MKSKWQLVVAILGVFLLAAAPSLAYSDPCHLLDTPGQGAHTAVIIYDQGYTLEAGGSQVERRMAIGEVVFDAGQGSSEYTSFNEGQDHYLGTKTCEWRKGLMTPVGICTGQPCCAPCLYEALYVDVKGLRGGTEEVCVDDGLVEENCVLQPSSSSGLYDLACPIDYHRDPLGSPTLTMSLDGPVYRYEETTDLQEDGTWAVVFEGIPPGVYDVAVSIIEMLCPYLEADPDFPSGPGDVTTGEVENYVLRLDEGSGEECDPYAFLVPENGFPATGQLLCLEPRVGPGP